MIETGETMPGPEVLVVRQCTGGRLNGDAAEMSAHWHSHCGGFSFEETSPEHAARIKKAVRSSSRRQCTRQAFNAAGDCGGGDDDDDDYASDGVDRKLTTAALLG